MQNKRLESTSQNIPFLMFETLDFGLYDFRLFCDFVRIFASSPSTKLQSRALYT
jgi:hypothetical protein